MHPNQTFDFKNPGDALKHAPRGGCSLICEYILNCGHICNNVCHLRIQDHTEINCQAPCERQCDAGIHRCKRACFIKCGHDCAELVCKELLCGHSAKIKCSSEPEEVNCMQKVEKNFPLCQHKDTVPCSSNNCPSPCTFQVPCGHSCTRKCHLDDDPDHLKYLCRKPCAELNKNCSGGHACKKACHEDCDICDEKV